MTDHSPIRSSIRRGVLTVELNRPPAHPLSGAAIDALQAELDRAIVDPGLRVIVLRASGHIFCAGHDLKEIGRHREDADGGRAFLQDLFARCSRLMQTVAEGPCPTIAMVDGLATAAGCQLVAACHLAFASERASFCTPGVNNGGYCSTPLVAISRSLSRKHALEMALSGETFDAAAALRFGLVNRVLPSGELETAVEEFAACLAGRNPAPIAEGLSAFSAQLGKPLDAAYAIASEAMIARFLDPAGMKFLDRFPSRSEAVETI